MKVFCFGEILLRLSPPNHLRFSQTTSWGGHYAGTEANVAVSLAQMGMPASFITAVPDNEIGKAALNELNRFGVDTTNCILTGDRLGIYFLEMGAGSRGSKIIYDRAGSSIATAKPGSFNWDEIFKNNFDSREQNIFHWSGITPAISQTAADLVAEAIDAAKKNGLTISCDLNYRANLWKYGKTPAEIMPALIRKTDIVLGDGNTNELYFGIKGKDYKQVFEKTFQKFPNLSLMVMTARNAINATHNTYKGFLHNGKQMFESKEYDIPEILDRIGAGDAFMAGILFKVSGIRYQVSSNDDQPTNRLTDQPTNLQFAVDFAAAAATLKHYVHGDFNLSTIAEIESLMHGNTGGRVSR